VIKVLVKSGDAVRQGQALVILEAMKMEHVIAAPREGIVEAVAHTVGTHRSLCIAFVCDTESSGVHHITLTTFTVTTTRPSAENPLVTEP
jgi:3-methylcrotonyl-CoA carboxylase alpha subunit